MQIVKTLQRPLKKSRIFLSQKRDSQNAPMTKGHETDHSGKFCNRMPFGAITMKEDERGHFFCGTIMVRIAQQKMTIKWR